ncbi:PDR/VanB family oxidoreductase [Allobranchiibius sp. GilTou73]|uniref:PDR/VanB family oxidoreductase n=1 Tax=Allobranchiibius sp. GilTou73 TaxID=2904523 RepID=UPI001F39B36B|nr:PDR/VanB family oxidoreductase [Allobranchiibius sp. GilTou73]UIJ34286.1 PDR/VanB family oxidoreductase [Allobranchiibius sp. GilTou73]
MTGRDVQETTLDLVVERIATPATGVLEVVLRQGNGAELPPWSAGAHIDVVTTDHVRQYSLCGDPTDATSWTIAVLREPDGRGGSAYLHDTLTADTTVQVRGPRNHFELAPAARYVFVAGGIGITPIIPMLTAAQSAGAEWTLTYGGRTRDSMAYADTLVERYGDRVRLVPQDEVGLIDLDALLGDPGIADALVYCCGPEPLLAAAEQRCADRPQMLRTERFAPKALELQGDAGEFEVELAESGTVLSVPADKSILQVLEEADVPILSSCTEGTCGTCETGVLDGVVDHRDSLLSQQEQDANDVIFVCVSRAKSARLVLEL